MIRKATAAFALVLAIAAATGAVVSPLAAHTEVWQRSPEMGLAYGGQIDELQISFFAAVDSGEITIVDPTGAPVAVGPTSLAQGNRITLVEFPELTEPGAYVVTHTELAADGDTQTASYQFFFDPGSTNEVESLIVGDDGPNWPLLGIIAAAVLLLAGLFWPGRSKR